MAGRLKELINKYGKVAIAVHLTVSALSYTSCYVAIKNNVDVKELLQRVGLVSSEVREPDDSKDGPVIPKIAGSKVLEEGGAFAVAFLCNKALIPVRVPLTVVLTPPIARVWARRRFFRPVRSGVAQRRASTTATTQALQYIAHGLSAVVEADRILPYTDSDDTRVQPLLKKAKENFELALEVENTNSDAMLLLSRLHMYYHIPGCCPASGASLLEAAADAGNAIAQYELACRLRAEGMIIGIGDGDGWDDKALKYLELAACQKHAGALFMMGSVYLMDKHTKRNVTAAAWCFRNAADQGHTAAATVYGALMARGLRVPNGESQENSSGNEHGAGSEKQFYMTESGCHLLPMNSFLRTRVISSPVSAQFVGHYRYFPGNLPSGKYFNRGTSNSQCLIGNGCSLSTVDRSKSYIFHYVLRMDASSPS
ncbi:hypothetical protein R1flu_018421 [Riccia fluitans]|uniref:DUF1279 domain-containing protein n=1 Tax=Riccia fluitans TaxID=41844 RepID=A0ABD1ZFT1_9MARC